MLITKLGPFNGKNWEDLCQLVFKVKHGDEGYQHMPADPGDFGLEGFTITSGIGFQCYCPEKNYESQKLYEAQRDKITRDLGKLKDNEDAIKTRIGDTKLGKWYFVTPIIDKHALLEHVRNKEKEVRDWKLSILADDFEIHLRDIDFYIQEIHQVQSLNGTPIVFDITPPVLSPLIGPTEEYEANVRRKSELRLSSKKDSPQIQKLVDSLYQQTFDNFLEGSGYLRKIEQDAPIVYFRLVRLLNEYEFQVKENATTWVGTAEELTAFVRDGLCKRIVKDLAPHIDETTANKISRHIVARWLAICELDFED